MEIVSLFNYNENPSKNNSKTVENTANPVLVPIDQRIKHGLYTRDSLAAALQATGARSEDARRGSTLSTAHIRPQIIYYAGASLLKTTKGRKCEQSGGGKRGRIQGFSRQSRRRLMCTIGAIRRDAQLPNFMTLTYPCEFPTVERAKRDLKVFLQRLEREYPDVGYIWKLEPQERGAPHYHLLVWGASDEWDLCKWTSNTWYEIAGQGDINHWKFHMGLLKASKPCVQRVKSWRGVWSYASKYLGKTFEVAQWGNTWTGRFWGIGSRDNIPFGDPCEIDLSAKQVIVLMRYQRRYAGMKGKDYNSLTIFCSADQWINRLVLPDLRE